LGSEGWNEEALGEINGGEDMNVDFDEIWSGSGDEDERGGAKEMREGGGGGLNSSGRGFFGMTMSNGSNTAMQTSDRGLNVNLSNH